MDQKIIRFTQGFSAAPNWALFVGPFFLGGAQFFFSHFDSIAEMLVLATLWRQPGRQQQQQQRFGGMHVASISSMKHSILPQYGPLKKSCQHQNYQFPPRIYSSSATPLSRQTNRVQTCPFNWFKNITHISNGIALWEILTHFSQPNGRLRLEKEIIIIP